MGSCSLLDHIGSCSLLDPPVVAPVAWSYESKLITYCGWIHVISATNSQSATTLKTSLVDFVNYEEICHSYQYYGHSPTFCCIFLELHFWASVSEPHTSRSLARGTIWRCTTYMYVCRSVSHTVNPARAIYGNVRNIAFIPGRRTVNLRRARETMSMATTKTQIDRDL